MAEARRDKFFERYAWILAVAGGLIWAYYGITNAISPYVIQTGSGYPPAAMTDLDSYARTTALLFLTGGALQIGAGATAFRRHEKWAWFALLSVPVLFGFPNSYFDTNHGVSVVAAVLIFLVYGGLTSVGLLLSIRPTFSTRQRIDTARG